MIALRSTAETCKGRVHAKPRFSESDSAVNRDLH
jgi:hypothetical protein